MFFFSKNLIICSHLIFCLKCIPVDFWLQVWKNGKQETSKLLKIPKKIKFHQFRQEIQEEFKLAQYAGNSITTVCPSKFWNEKAQIYEIRICQIEGTLTIFFEFERLLLNPKFVGIPCRTIFVKDFIDDSFFY